MGEYRNLEAALRLALDTQAAELGLRLACTLQFVWKFRLPVGEGRPWIEAVLAPPGAEAPKPARAVSLLTAARLAWERGDYLVADGYYSEAVPLARKLSDPWIPFVALADQGLASEQRRDYDLALALWQEGLAVTRASGDRASEAIVLMCLGRLHLREAISLASGEFPPDRVTFREENAEDLSYPSDSFDACLSLTVMEEGDADRMRAEMVRVTRPGGHVGVVAVSLRNRYQGLSHVRRRVMGMSRMQDHLVFSGHCTGSSAPPASRRTYVPEPSLEDDGATAHLLLIIAK